MQAKNRQPITLEALENSRHTAEAQIATHKSERAEALLSGQAFDASKLRAEEDGLEGILDAIILFQQRAEAERREEEAAEAALSVEERRERVRTRMSDLALRRGAAIDSMEASARAMLNARTLVQGITAELRTTIQAETGRGSLGLMASEVDRRFGQHLSAVINKATASGRLGGIVLAHSLVDAAMPWRAGERNAEAEIVAALEKLGG